MKSFVKIIQEGARQYPLLTVEEEVELAERIANDDEEAAKRLAGSNIRLVIAIAADFRGCGLEFDEIVSEGFLGLLTAVDKFKPNKGAKFSTYASWWIKQAIRKKATENAHIIEIPISTLRKINKIKRLLKKHMLDGATKEDAIKLIAVEMELREKTVIGLLNKEVHTVSMQKHIGGDTNAELGEIIQDESSVIPFDNILTEENLELLKTAVNSKNITDRERVILIGRFGLDGEKPLTLEKVSDKVGVTRERVRQIQNKALLKLQAEIKHIEEN